MHESVLCLRILVVALKFIAFLLHFACEISCAMTLWMGLQEFHLFFSFPSTLRKDLSPWGGQEHKDRSNETGMASDQNQNLESSQAH